MSEANPPTRTVYTSDLEPGDVVTCGPREFVRIIHEDINVVRLSPGEAFQVDDDPRGVVLPESLDAAGADPFVTDPDHVIVTGRYDALQLLSGGGTISCPYYVPDQYVSPDVLAVARGTLALLREQGGVLADALEEAGFAAAGAYELERLRNGTMTPQEVAAMVEYITSRGT